MNTRTTTWINVALSQLGWFACVLGGAWHYPGYGTFLGLLFLSIHIWLTRDRAGELLFLLGAGAIGGVVEAAHLGLGAYAFSSGNLIEGVAPTWIFVLWMGFAGLFRFSLSWLRGRFGLAVLMGALGGPLAFIGGSRLGAVEFAEPLWRSVTVISLGWAVAMPALLALSMRFAPGSTYRAGRLAVGAVPTALLALAFVSPNKAMASKDEPLEATREVIDLNRFMGDWYVQGFIPVTLPGFSEAKAHNAVESYELAEDGTIETTYRFRKGSFDGRIKTMRPKGWVHNKESNSEWRMQFIWPFKAVYLIAHIDERYQATIVGVPNRRYVWIMTRSREITDEAYERLVSKAVELGYDRKLIRRVPQRWPAEDPTSP